MPTFGLFKNPEFDYSNPNWMQLSQDIYGSMSEGDYRINGIPYPRQTIAIDLNGKRLDIVPENARDLTRKPIIYCASVVYPRDRAPEWYGKAMVRLVDEAIGYSSFRVFHAAHEGRTADEALGAAQERALSEQRQFLWYAVGNTPDIRLIHWIKSYDWFYSMSDDSRVWAAGEASTKYIRAAWTICKEWDAARARLIWDALVPKEFVGKDWSV